MARVFIDGFESGTSGLWTPPTAGAQEGLSKGFSSAFATAAISGAYMTVPLPSATFYYAAVKMRVNYFDYERLAFFNGATVLASLHPIAGVGIGLNLGSGGTLVVSAPPVIVGNTVYNVEWYYLPSTSSTGRSIVKVNGGIAFDYTGVTAAASGNITGFGIMGSSGSGAAYFDDVVVDNSSWPGATRIQALTPTAAGSSAGHTPSTNGAANYTMVDEVPYSDTDYVYTAAPDTTDLYTMSDFVPPTSNVPWQIKCVQPQVRAQYEGISAVTQVALTIKPSGGSVTTGTSVPASTVWNSASQIWETNPATGLPWTTVTVNSLECGFTTKA